MFCNWKIGEIRLKNEKWGLWGLCKFEHMWFYLLISNANHSTFQNQRSGGRGGNVKTGRGGRVKSKKYCVKSAWGGVQVSICSFIHQFGSADGDRNRGWVGYITAQQHTNILTEVVGEGYIYSGGTIG